MNKEQKLKLLKLKREARMTRTAPNKKAKDHDNKQANNNTNNTTDERFERVSYDPRFVRVPKQISKVKIDKRFNKMMTDDRFKMVTQVDKYGRKIPAAEVNQELKQFYYQDEEPQEEGSPQQEDDNAIIEQENVVSKKPKGYSRDIKEWMQNYSEQSDSQSSLSVENQQEQLEMWQDDKDVIKGENVQATRRLALCNYDWMNINAKDLMVLFNSFKPLRGVIVSVTVYPSDLGLKKMKEEQLKGPQDIWNENTQQQTKVRSTGNHSLRSTLKGQQNGDECLDPQKLRAYQRERLRYYYAVIQCNTKETADQIYKTCDGRDLENSGQLDLRFIPDELQFPHKPHDFCDELPSKAESKQTINRAVGHSKVNLTWEDPQLNTIASLKKKDWGKMTDKQMDQVDWSLYLNDDEMSDQQQRPKQPKHRIENDQSQEENIPGWKKEYHNKSRRKDSSQSEEMEITFTSGFDIADKIKQKRQQGKLSSYELYQKKSKEKRVKINEEKRIRKQQQKLELVKQERDGKNAYNTEKKQRQQLELLVDKQDKRPEFKANVNDPRFSDVFTNPLYHIEPTSHHFKVTKNTKLLEEVVKRKRNTAQ